MSHKCAICYVGHDDHYFFAASIRSFHCGLPMFLFLSTTPWHGEPGNYQKMERIAKSLGVTVIKGDWPSEEIHRNAAYDWLRANGFTYSLVPDGDEIIEPNLLSALLKIAENGLADRVYVEWNTYWRGPDYVIRPREPFTPIMLVNLEAAKYERVRDWSGGRSILLNDSQGIVHHLSYAGDDRRILRKLTSWGHRDQVRPGFFDEVWSKWPSDKFMNNLHPTHPQNYGFAEHIHVPDLLKSLLDLEESGISKAVEKDSQNSLKKRTKGKKTPSVQLTEVDLPGPGGARLEPSAQMPSTTPGQGDELVWPTVSVVIPLYGGADDIALCLRSLLILHDLVLETIIVDNGSPDGAAEVAEGISGVPGLQVIRLGENRGFAAACNEGIRRAKGEVVLLLNSDTVLPRAGLIELIRSLSAAGTIAAAGPYTNQAGHGQQVGVTYTSLDTIDLFAQDFAERDAEDMDTDMLVGFCLAIKRRALDEVGLLDEDFGFGTYEDNDICYRLRRAGYRLVLSGRSFVHHAGSSTIKRCRLDMDTLMTRNRQHFLDKWRRDLELGYVNTLSGLNGAIRFDPSRQPERKLKEIARLAKKADISLCMIVRDEEKNIGACLDSIRPFVREMIVIDTGSKDRTKEIAAEKGARVIDFPWTNSFSEARNESLKYAKGKWIFWMDADDVIDLASGEALLRSALNAPKNIAGFVVPVRFTDDGPAGGVQVDHVKLFRNGLGAQFELHIHEQIINSLKKHGRQIVRCNAFVLHKGYDTSPEGQAKKRERDRVLLDLDLKENPDHPFVQFNCGMTAHYTDDHESAVQFLTRSIELADPDQSHVRKAYALLAQSLDKLGRKGDAFEMLRSGLSVLPDDPELHFLMAKWLTNAGRLAEARDHYTAVIGTDISCHYSSVDRGIFTFKTLHNRAEVDLALGHYKDAKEGWIAAIKAAPNFMPSIFSLFSAAISVQDLTAASEMMDLVRAMEGHGETWCGMAVRYSERLGGAEGAYDLIRQAVAGDRFAAAPRLWLARHLLNTGREGEATPYLHDLQARGVAEAAFHLGLMSEKEGDYRTAFYWMERADQLNPEHEETLKHLAQLKECLAEEEAQTA